MKYFTYEIYQSLDDGYEVTGVFLDISIAFDKVWHSVLLYKLRQNSIAGNFLNDLMDFLKDRKQSVIFNGQHCSWANVEGGVPQGSVLRPLPFLIYIGNLSDDLTSNPKSFANNTSLFSIVKNINNSRIDLNNDLIIINGHFSGKLVSILNLRNKLKR